MAYDREPPTRHLTPQPPHPQDVPVALTPDEAAFRQEVLDRLRSLRTGLALTAVLAVVALGVGVYALLEATSDDEGPRGASRTTVSRLDARVDDLESRLDDRATKSSVGELREQQEEIDQQVSDLSKRAGEQQQDDDVTQQVEDLRGDLDQLQQRVDELAQQQQAEEGQTP